MNLTVAACRTTIATRNDEIRALLHVLPKPLRDPIAGPDAPLYDVPYVLKDVWDTAGIPTTGGSFRHKDRVPTESSRVFVALQKTGAVLLGKSNLCDLAFSIESDNHIFGPVRNPIDLSRTAGGSTGGGAAAIASGMAAFEWGTDFGGSIRLPAAFCGVVGMRLSASTWSVDREHFPRISPRFYSFCGMGPLTRRVNEAKKVVSALAPSLSRPPDATLRIDRDRVALFLPDSAHLGRWPSFEADARALLLAAGVEAEPASLPTPSEVHEAFTAYLSSHFLDFIGREEMGVAEGLAATALGLATGGRFDKRIHPVSGALFALVGLGKLVRYRDPAPQIAKAERLREAVQQIWSSGRLIVSPATTSLPPRHGRAIFALRAPSFVMLGNLVDATALVLPFGRFAGSPLPRSLQILGPPGSEQAVFDLAERLERAIRASD